MLNNFISQLHRIAAAHATKWYEGIWTTTEGSYNTSYAYDGNGNIHYLYRNNRDAVTIDELEYYYDGVKKNRLDAVKDIGGTAEGLGNTEGYEYTYDKIGNLVKNATDGIENIEWNIYGKVKKVTKTPDQFGIQATIDYRYDGTGNRIMKKVSAGATRTTTTYLRDASGNVMAIYEEKTDQRLAVKEIPIYGSSRLGQYRPKTDAKKTALGQRIYEFSNHLGNVLVTLTDNKVPQTDGTYESVVLSASDYYPFGMAMKERSFANSEYRFGFNGKENDTDFGDKQLIQDYGFRLYNPALGRFLSVDPLTNGYPWYTPYQFAGNMPIDHIDVDGLEEYHFVLIVKDDGCYAWEYIGMTPVQTRGGDYFTFGLFKPEKRWVFYVAEGKTHSYGDSDKAKEVLSNPDGAKKLDVMGSDETREEMAIATARGLSENASNGAISRTGRSSKKASTANQVKKGCFVANTLVSIGKEFEKIENLIEGDSVLSKDEITGEEKLKKVLQIFIKQVDQLVILNIDSLEKIQTTKEHPFWVIDKWVDAGNLQIGDSLFLQGGDKKIVTNITILDTLVTVYNMEVEDFHTYFVSENKVWVHNNDCNLVHYKDDNPRHRALAEERGKVTSKGQYEADGILEAEKLGLISNPIRPEKAKTTSTPPDVDFIISKTSIGLKYADVKTPIDTKYRSVEDQYADVSKSLNKYKNADGSTDTMVIINLGRLTSNEKAIFRAKMQMDGYLKQRPDIVIINGQTE